jgi:N-acetylmuramic acid 6-phosphate etherase
MSDLASLPTEARNPHTMHIDEMSTLDMLAVINDEDATVAGAVRTQLPQIASAVDSIVERFARGGRLFYIGAGTSGRLGVLDASECPPTFSVAPTLVQGLIAGGDSALRRSSEHSEDSREEGARDLATSGFGVQPDAARPTPDTVVGIAASGRTPYVLGALEHARGLGALTVGLSCVADSPVARASEIAITPVTGPEVLTGSTRLKAGTATKLVLNMLSTGVMIRTGATYGNLMVNVQPTNAKLVDRAERIIVAGTDCEPDTARQLLQQAGSVKTAILMHSAGLTRADAESRLAAARGSLSRALRQPI